MIACSNPYFVYLPPPKTGSHSIWEVLRGLFHTWRVGGDKHEICFKPRMRHSFVFASVRCPYSRIVSWYHWFRRTTPAPWWTPKRWSKYELAGKISLREFLSHPDVLRDHANPIARKLAGLPVHAYVRMEHMQDDLQALPFMQDKQFTLPRLHATRYRAPWYKVYQQHPELLDVIYERCKDDFRLYGYHRDLERHLETLQENAS